jgi:hypothetical protein
VLSVVCWMWNVGFRTFLPEHVNVQQRMVARHLPLAHRFICIADDTTGFSPDVEVLKTPPEAARVGLIKSPEGPRFPSCYRRLWTFSQQAKEALGERVLLMDIDLVITGNLTPLFDIDADFVGWRPFRDWGRPCRFGGGIYLLRTGTRTHVWDQFTGLSSIDQARKAGFRGSDQAWISYLLASKEVYWDRKSGIYSIRDMRGKETMLPNDARLVQFNGPQKPWQSRLPWVGEHWR